MTPHAKIKGTVYRKGPSWYFAFMLRKEDRERSGRARYFAKVTRRDGAVDRDYATKVKNDRCFAYERRLWNPIDVPDAAKPGAAPTVREFGRRWLDGLTHTTAPNDRMWFERFVAPTDLAAMKLADVRPRHVKAFVEALKLTPAVKRGTLAPRSIRNVYSVVHKLFAAATFDEVIAASPAMLPRGTMPKIADKDPLARRTWIREWKDVERLMTAAEVPPDRRVLYALEFYTGARFSEIAAARWLAWDPKRKPLGCLSIAYSRDLHTGEDKPTKTGVPREVPVHPRLAKILAEWKRKGWREHYGTLGPTPEDRIVPTRELTARDPRNNWTRHKEDCGRLEIDQKRQHDARRTFISALRNAGVPSDVVNAITHGRESTIQGSYTEFAWKVLCAAVSNLPNSSGAKRGRGHLSATGSATRKKRTRK